MGMKEGKWVIIQNLEVVIQDFPLGGPIIGLNERSSKGGGFMCHFHLLLELQQSI